ncbi:cytochrome c oxidase assembly protein [Ktedonosporobacter rubrisoli]|uniref:Cytochrome c oxidase assembly protein n=1 Tax=Ktedonosporobacter rubrisoli TaxID=2509675 RepID=A0A4P6K4Q7_KTERU|nr:cytochrome c oxidase assembly protein [Ktedonosporobacter rubrisoli]QBD82506.1 cytochrome c oxidase assembly protein [Ktedonosporobacter rubrisoli]
MQGGLSSTWNWNPVVLIFLLGLSLLYIFGVRAARRRYAQNQQDEPIRGYHIVAFFAAILIAAAMFLTPIATIGRTQLFVIHMAQVVILITLCTPLMMFACPKILLRIVLEAPVVGTLVRWLTFPVAASVIFNLVFLLWHTPTLFDMAQASPALYDIELLSIFVTSWLNWWPLIGSKREHHMSYPVQILYTFFDGQPVDILAFILVFSGTTVYPHYVPPAQFGIPLFGDQASGGALLLAPGLVDFIVMTPLFFRWLGQIEQRTRLDDLRRQEEAELEEDDELELEEGEIELGNEANM